MDAQSDLDVLNFEATSTLEALCYIPLLFPSSFCGVAACIVLLGGDPLLSGCTGAVGGYVWSSRVSHMPGWRGFTSELCTEDEAFIVTHLDCQWRLCYGWSVISRWRHWCNTVTAPSSVYSIQPSGLVLLKRPSHSLFKAWLCGSALMVTERYGVSLLFCLCVSTGDYSSPDCEEWSEEVGRRDWAARFCWHVICVMRNPIFKSS